MKRLLLAAAALAALALPAPAADESLVLQPSAASAGPGATVEIQVLVRVHPNGKAAVPVRAVDCALVAKGGGTVAPLSELPGEVKWLYRAPDAVATDLSVVVEGRLRNYPDATGACALTVKAPGGAKPAAPTPPAGAAPPPANPSADDEDGDLVEGAEAAAADPVGKMVTLEKWRAKASAGEEWNERKIPERGEPLYAPGEIQEFRFRINVADPKSVTVQWWRGDRPKKVRAFTEKNRQLDLERDQDGFPHAKFVKWLNREKGEYTFAVVVVTADGKTLRENLVVHRARPPREEDEDGKGKGKGKR